MGVTSSLMATTSAAFFQNTVLALVLDMLTLASSDKV